MADHKGRWRRVFAVLFVALFVVLLPVTVTATWAHHTVLDEEGWIDTVGPIAEDRAVTAALSRQITDEVFAALQPDQAIADSLPPRARFLAAPIATGVHEFIRERVDKIVENPKFAEVWIAANRTAHARLVKVLRGDSEALETTNGQVVLNLVPLLNSVLVELQGFATNVVGKPVDLPSIKSDEVPASACEKIANALDRPVRPNCGQIVLFPADNLTNAQRAVRAFDRSVLALLIVVPLVALVALLLSLRRRRTLLQLSIGGILGLVLVRRSTMWLESQLVAGATPQNRAARQAIVNHALDSYMSITQWLLIGGLVITVLALLAGPYRWAVALRSWVSGAVRSIGHLATRGFSGDADDQSDDSTVSWVQAHVDLLAAAGVVVAALVLLLVSLPFWGFVALAVVLALYELWLFRLHRPPTTAAG